MKRAISRQFIVHSLKKIAKTVNRSPRFACETGYPLTKNRPGQTLIVAIIFLAVVLVLASTLFTRVANFIRFGATSILREQASNLAEAGIDHTVWQLNESAGACASCGTEIYVGTTGSFITTIVNKSANVKTITSTGYVPNSSQPRGKRTIKVDVAVSTTSISFHYAVQTDEGGVNMANSARINGTVYSNGSISGSGSSSIGGDAYAVSFITSPDPSVDVGFNKYPFSSPQPMPTFDYQTWRDAAADGGTIDCSVTPSQCNIDGGTATIGPKKYIGDLTISNQAVVTVNGPIWVAKDIFGNGGNVTVRNGNTEVNIAQSFGSNGTVWVSDGDVRVEQGAAFKPTNATPPGYLLVATSSTSSTAMSIGQSGANAVFYALEGNAELSQTAQVNSLTAYRLTMTQSSILNYDSGLASAIFTSGPGGSWQIKRGTYKFTSSP